MCCSLGVLRADPRGRQIAETDTIARGWPRVKGLSCGSWRAYEWASGVLVTGVQSGSPAEQAGITPSSVITKVGSTSVDSAATLGNALHAYKPGANVAVTWVDPNGGSHTKNVTLTTGPNI